ncbi:MAG: metal-dependent hydrolase [Chitinophagaceae bacterium]|nr:metal-dependent hydrolase [Chitinophagaceae bacterium]
MKLTFYGHACFSVQVNGKNLLFDPFISGNELAHSIHVDQIQADYILLSHGHADHILDCEAIALRTGAKVICNWEVHEWLHGKGVTHTHPMNTGGQWDFEDFRLKCVVAQHSSSLPDGNYGGNPMGFIIYAGEESFYYSGDTALTMDMQLLPLWAKLKFAVLPIGDNFTMGIDDAIKASGMIQCKKIVGVHYDTFGYIKIDHEQAKARFQQDGAELILLDIGESTTL